MTETAFISTASSEEQEEWFLDRLEEESPPAGEMMDALKAQAAEGRWDRASAWSELLLEALSEKGPVPTALSLVELRLDWCDEKELASRCQKECKQAVSSDAQRRKFIEHAGFDKGLTPRECLRRLKLLFDLKPEVLCYDKTWGFGIIQYVDDFYAQVEINFDKKRDHQMSFSYAAETLDLLHEDHLLARKHFKPEETAELIKKNPFETVRLALRDFGPMNVGRLQEVLIPVLVPEADWKRFWDKARKGLKEDNMIVFPSKRSEPIRIREQELAYDRTWLEEVASERNLEDILDKAETFRTRGDLNQWGSDAAAVFGERLQYVLKGAGIRKPHLVARALKEARLLSVSKEYVDIESEMIRFLDPEMFLQTSASLPVKETRAFLVELSGFDKEKTTTLLMELLPRLEVSLIEFVVQSLVEHGLEEACSRQLRSMVDARKVPMDVLAWMIKVPDRIDSWKLGSLPVINDLILGLLEREGTTLRTKGRNQLFEQFQKDAWLQPVLRSMNTLQRKELLLRMKDTAGFPSLERRGVMGKMIKMYPELQEYLVSKALPSTNSIRVTSKRRYRERQDQLYKIINKDIPQNSKEIGVARSYGDLRENFEYKAAKEMQAILMRRRDELEQMLQGVSPTDFNDISTSQAGMGTWVTIRYEDGNIERYALLGEWDSDGGLGIISCDSPMAKALIGHKPGEQIHVPSETGEVACTLEDVSALSEDVRRWIEAPEAS